MFKKIICILFLLMANFVAAQNFIKHVVAKGETITIISQKYKITPAAIYKLNPDAQNVLKTDMVLLIPNDSATKKQNKDKKTTIVKHTVLAKETLFGLAKMYGVTESDIEKANPEIVTNGLKLGTIINIPSIKGAKTIAKNQAKSNIKTKEIVFHQVEAKETKFSIAKQYGISIEELEKANPEIVSGLQIGFRLKIVGNNVKNVPKETVIRTEEVVQTNPETPKTQYIDYEVKAKETLYSLSRKFGLKQVALVQLNPDLKDGVKEGMNLKLPSDILINESLDMAFADLSQTLKTTNTGQKRKQLVLMLPFNISKIENDTIRSVASSLKTDKFLNLTLDFYSGALIAIDSAKTLGLDIDVKIFDSQETKNSSNVLSIIQQNNLSNSDIVIGPFYQNNVEKAAEVLLKNNVIVISPLSKDAPKPFENLLQSMPSPEIAKSAIFNYMHNKNGNIIAIVDPKKLSTKQFLTQEHKDVKLVVLTEKGGVIAENVVKDLVKGQINYVILDSEKTGMILNTLNVLIGLMPNYHIQLVILEKNETLDFEEIPLAKLAKLKMLYPSFTKENETQNGAVFEKMFKEKNKIFPNQYATRGFDVTFDTMLRMSQEKDFAHTIQTVATEQAESKFEYEKSDEGNFTNKGIYILHYDIDLSVKEAQ